MTALGQRIFKTWAGLVSRSAILLVAAIFILTAWAGVYTARNLAIITSTTDMISPETPFRKNAIEFDKAFPQFDDLIVVVIDAPTPERAEMAARHLVSATRSKKAIFERVEWPDGDPFFRQNGLLYRSAEELSALGDRLAVAAPLLSTLAQRPNLEGLFDVLTLALKNDSADPAIGKILERIAKPTGDRMAGLSWRELFALDERRRQIVLIKASVEGDSLSPGTNALDAIRKIARGIDGVVGDPEGTSGIVSVRLTGPVALDKEELESAAVGGKTAGLISLAFVTILLVAGLRSPWLILPALLTLIAGLIWTAAFAALAIGHLNLISVAFAVLFVGLGIDFSIHFCLRYREALKDMETPADAVGQATVGVGGSLAIGALCAALGFLSFLPTDYRGLAELGVISAGGMGIALFLNLTLLPALLTLLPKPSPMIVMRRPARARQGRAVVLAALGLGAVAAVFAMQLRFDFNPMNLKDPESESVRTFYSLAEDRRNGVYAIDILAKDRVAAKANAQHLQGLAEVGTAVTVDSLIPKDQEEKLAIIEDMSFFLVPALEPSAVQGELSDAQRIAAVSAFRAFLLEYSERQNDNPFAAAARGAAAMLADAAGNPVLASALERRLVEYLPGMIADLKSALSAERVTYDGLPHRIREGWVTPDGRARIQLRAAEPVKSNEDLRRFATAVLAAVPTATGTPVTITEAGGAVVAAFQEATLYAFAAVCIVLLIVLRSVRDLALVIFPLILAAVYTGATSVFLSLPLNFANVIVLPLLFGLGVASGIHLVARARRTGDIAALMRTSTPRAVMLSALTTIASFGSLALSGHRGMTSMGQLLTIAIVFTLICALIVLPAALRWMGRPDGE